MAGTKLATGAWTVATVDAVTAATRPKLEKAQAEIRRLRAASNLGVLADVAGPEARQRWDVASLGLRRAVLEALGVRVVILRVGGRGPGFDHRSVRIEWPE
jgi:site-specific DNA recombinase